MSRRYTITEKRKLTDLAQADWSKRIKILTLRQTGLTYAQIGAQLGISHQAVMEVYKKISTMSIAEAEAIAQSLE